MEQYVLIGLNYLPYCILNPIKFYVISENDRFFLKKMAIPELSGGQWACSPVAIGPAAFVAGVSDN